MTVFGTRLKEAMKLNGIKAPTLAKRIDSTVQAIYAWRDGENEPRLYALRSVASALDVNPAWLLVPKTPGASQRKHETKRRKTMNWKKEAENDLRNYARRLEALANSQERIRALRERAESIRAGISDSTPVQGGGNRAQENIVNCLAEIERLELTMQATARLVALVEKGLSSLSPKEQRVLDLFYIHRERGHVERLMELMNLEQAQVYRIKDAALYKFTVSIYGLTEY